MWARSGGRSFAAGTGAGATHRRTGSVTDAASAERSGVVGPAPVVGGASTGGQAGGAPRAPGGKKLLVSDFLEPEELGETCLETASHSGTPGDWHDPMWNGGNCVSLELDPGRTSTGWAHCAAMPPMW